MSDELDDLSPLAKRLVDAERRRPGDADAVSARLLARVGATVVAGVAVTGVATAATAASAGAAAAPLATTAKSAAVVAKSAASLGLTAKALPWIVLAFAAGGGAGAAVHAVVATSTPRAVATLTAAPTAVAVPTSAAPPSPLPTSDTPTITPSDLPSSPSSVGPSVTRPAASIAPSAGLLAADVDLAAERALVDRARTAMTRGHQAAALEALASHATRFPRGRLVEEREALAVQALAQSGRTAEAKSRADAFRKAFPNSIFGPAVDLAAP